MTYNLKDLLLLSPKLHTAEDLLKHLDAIIEIARDDVARIARSRCKFFADFDFAYQLAAEATRLTLKKRNLAAVRKILSCGDLARTTEWLISRLLNNMINLTTNNNYRQGFDMRGISFISYDEILTEDKNLNLLEVEDSLNKVSEVELKKGLKKAFRNGTNGSIDLNEAEYICQKYNFNLTEILGYNPYNIPDMRQERTKSGHSQLVLLF